MTGIHYTEEQLDGHACVVCSRDLTQPGAPASTPVGNIPGHGQVFACDDPHGPHNLDGLCTWLLTGKTASGRRLPERRATQQHPARVS